MMRFLRSHGYCRARSWISLVAWVALIVSAWVVIN